MVYYELDGRVHLVLTRARPPEAWVLIQRALSEYVPRKFDVNEDTPFPKSAQEKEESAEALRSFSRPHGTIPLGRRYLTSVFLICSVARQGLTPVAARNALEHGGTPRKVSSNRLVLA